MNPSKAKNFLFWLSAAALYLVIYGYNLWVPDEMYYDEVYFVKTARQMIHLDGYLDTVQPPFGKLLIALSMMIFGDHSWSWRLVSLAAGFGCLFFVYEITRVLTKKPLVAFFTAFLFFFDGVSFTQARIGMLNAPMFFFMLLSLWCVLKHAVTGEWERRRAFFLSGMFLGLSIGTRLVGLSIAALLFIFYLKLWKNEKNKISLIRDTLLYFVFVSFIFYESTYLIIPFIKGFDWSSIWKLQVSMTKYHLHLKKGHTYGSEWWSWILMSRPIWYHFKMNLVDGINQVRGILCIGNPLIFWLIPAVMVNAVIEFFKRKEWIYAVAVTGFFTQWLQWAPVSRVKFFHYIYTAMPFMAIALALFLDHFWRAGKSGKIAVAAYLTAVVAMFFYWYPLYNGMLITETYFRQHMWFNSWI